MDEITIFAPATVANVSCGYDVLGFALEALGDEMIFKKTDAKGVIISKIEGANLPFNTKENVAGIVAQTMLEDSNADFGLDIQIFKNFKPGSGLGSSAASAAGTAFAVNQFLNNKYTNLELVEFGMIGEELACGAKIADNVAACLYGGFILIRSFEPLDIISIPKPDDLIVAIIHPQIEIKTEDARKVIPSEVPIKEAIAQWANVGALISGLHSGDFNLIGKSLKDYVAEPARKHLIPHFDEVKTAAINNGALGVGISGSGPSIFALCEGMDVAKNVGKGMNEVYQKTKIEYSIYTSKINQTGVRIK